MKAIQRFVTTGCVAAAISMLAGCATIQPPATTPSAAPTQSVAPVKTYAFRDALKSGEQGPEMVLVRAGAFRMGDNTNSGHADEQPPHDVRIEQPLAIGKFEVTVADFRRFVAATNYKTNAETGNGCFTFSGPNKTWNYVEQADWQQPSFSQDASHPVVCVSWNDAVAYTQWLSEQTGEKYRLPTEAEWEYVARAGTETNYGFADTGECNNINCCTGITWLTKQTRPVGSYVVNPFGVFDMAGNVWEWTASEYTNNYNGKELQGSDPAQLNTQRVVRGGSWYNFAVDTRAGLRGKNWPQERFSTVGFRVVRDVTAEFAANAERQMQTTTVSALSDK